MNHRESSFIQITFDPDFEIDQILNDSLINCLLKRKKNSQAKVIVRIRNGKFTESVRNLQEYFFTTYRIALLSKNFDHIKFINYDELEFENPSSKIASCILPKQIKPKVLNLLVSENTLDNFINDLHKKETAVVDSYQALEILGLSIASGYGERGRDWFIKLSGTTPAASNEHFTEFLQNRNRKNVPKTAFYWILACAGLAIPITPDEKTAGLIALIARQVGMLPEESKSHIESLTGIDHIKSSEIISEVYDRHDLSLQEIAESPDTRGRAFELWLRFKYGPVKNLITRRIESFGETLEIEHFNSIWLEAREAFNSDKINFELVERSILSKKTPEYNPITEYIEANRYRTSTGNIDKLIQTIIPTNQAIAVFIRKWMISLAAAHAGHPVRSMLILISGQNTGKTEWFRRLLPQELLKYYAETKFEHGKDDAFLMTEKLILMIDELAGLPQKDFKSLKELSSKNIFSLRSPYGRHNIDVKRLAILAGTSNEKIIMNDPTGNSRLLPVEFERVDFDLYNSIDKDELFMEAVREFETGAEWQLSLGELMELEKMSEDFRDNSDRELIMQYFRVPGKQDVGEYLTISNIKNIIKANSGQQSHKLKNLGIELKKIFGEAKSVRLNGHIHPLKCFYVVRTNENVVESKTVQVSENEEIPF